MSQLCLQSNSGACKAWNLHDLDCENEDSKAISIAISIAIGTLSLFASDSFAFRFGLFRFVLRRE